MYKLRASYLICLLLVGGGILSSYGQNTRSVLSTGNWYKIAIAQTGIYKLSVNELPALQGRPLDSIALYGSTGDMLEENNALPHPDDLKPCSFKISDLNNNGQFDNTDYLLFYAQGPNVWHYNTATLRFEHTRHPYANNNYLFLCTNKASQRIVSDQTPATANQPLISQHTACGLYEKDLLNIYGSSQIWMGEKFSTAIPSRTFTISLPSAASNASTILTRIGLVSLADATSRFSVSCNGESHSLTIYIYEKYKTLLESFPTIASSNALNFTISYAGNSAATGYLDFIETNTLVPTRYTEGTQLQFRSTENLGNANVSTFSVSCTTAPTQIWDVTALDSIVSLTLTTSENAVRFTNATDRIREYVAFRTSDALTPTSIAPLSNQNLHGATNPDMVIITHADYLPQANQIASLHSVYDQMEVLVATQEQVFNEFSYGKKDPIAIRQFMRMFHLRATNSPALRKPRYLLLLGKGTYDNRDIEGHTATTLVTYQSPTNITTESSASVSDDIFGYLDTDESGIETTGLDVSIGRLPAKSATEANLLCRKIENYITRSDIQYENIRGDWRNYVTLLADDADPSSAGDKDFAESSEYAANLIRNEFPWVNMDKIYADAFTQQSGTIGSFYPDVNNALQQRINYGCLLLNYIGHGSDLYIGTERYMEPTHIDNYSNTNRLTFFVTSTCSFGKYDRMESPCGAELFVLAPAAGIGAIAAARPISHIKSFNTDVILNVLRRENTIGDALRLAKNKNPMIQNRSITLLGDPALHLTFPQYEVAVTSINGKAVTDSITDSAQVLSEVVVEGEIRDSLGIVQEDFNGLIFPLVFDRPSQCRTLANDNEGTEVDFTQQKNILYKGRDSVVNGHFRYSFIVPRDVAYQYGYGKLSHYAKSPATGNDASGAYNNIMFGGFNQDADLSETRPIIRLYMNDSTFVNGGITNESPTLFAILKDEVGINAVGSGLGHDITAILDESANNIVILNDLYETDIKDYHRGYIRYQFQNLTPGRHTLTLKAWNIYNYSNSATIHFFVHSNDSVTIGQLRCQPNPASTHTTLRIDHNSPTQITQAQINIYNIQGQLVRQLSPTVSNTSFGIGPVEWDLRNDAGNNLPIGIYIARVTLTTANGDILTSVTKIAKNK